MSVSKIEEMDIVKRTYRRSKKAKQPLAKCVDEWIKDYIKRVGDDEHEEGHHYAFEHLCELHQKIMSADEELEGIYTTLKEITVGKSLTVKKRMLNTKGKKTLEKLIDAFFKWLSNNGNYDVTLSLQWLADRNRLKKDFVQTIFAVKKRIGELGTKTHKTEKQVQAMFDEIEQSQSKHWTHKWDVLTFSWQTKQGKQAKWGKSHKQHADLDFRSFMSVWINAKTKTDVARHFNFSSMEAVNDYAHIVNNRLSNDGYALPNLPDYTKEEQAQIDLANLKKQMEKAKIPKNLLEGLVKLNPAT